MEAMGYSFTKGMISMRSVSLEKVIPISVFILYLVFFFSTILLVPFHPDESTQIYMSHDVGFIFTAPGSLFFHPETTLTPEQRYRLIDAPLPRTIIGITRGIFHLPLLKSDWNWSLSWEDNKNNGALPANFMLLIARLSLAVFVPIGLVLNFLILRDIVIWPISLLATVVLGMNAIFLVHTRRAMAEGLSFCLFFTVIFVIIRKPEKAFLIGMLAGLAFQAKQTNLPVLIVPVIIWIINGIKSNNTLLILKKILIFCGAIFVTYYVLNPVAWKDPFHVAILQVQHRLIFSQAQAADYQAISSSLAVSTFPSRLAAWLANTFFATPAYYDIGNYSKDLASVIKVYVSIFINRLFTGWYSGLVILFFGLFGFLFSIRKIKSVINPENRTLLVLFIASLLQTLFALFMFPITFQRYYLLNVSLSFLWAGIGLNYLYIRLNISNNK
jgi:hypothetical protein